MELVVLVGVLFGLSWWLVERIRARAVRRGWLDVPCARSAHVRPVPRLGGVPVGALIAVGLGVGIGSGALPGSIAPLVGVSLLVLAVGLVDDLRGLPATPRLATHFLAAAFTVWAVGPIDLVGFDAHGLDLGRWATPLTVVWLAWFINAFNFMDGIDGIAGTHAAVAGAGWVIIGALAGTPLPIWLGAIVAASVAGFLVHNWAPARLFMGDAGATCVGYWLAVLPLMATEPWQAACGLLLLWPFVFDATATVLQRVHAGEVLANGHQRHYYQRLVRAGWSHPAVAVLYGAWSAALGAAGLATEAGLVPAALPAAVALGGGAGLAGLVRWRERVPSLAAPQKEV